MCATAPKPSRSQEDSTEPKIMPTCAHVVYHHVNGHPQTIQITYTIDLSHTPGFCAQHIEYQANLDAPFSLVNFSVTHHEIPPVIMQSLEDYTTVHNLDRPIEK